MEELQERLMKNCSQFLADRKQLVDEELKLLGVKNAMNKTEFEVNKDVLNAVDDNGKPLYSNDAKRSLALKEKLLNHLEYSELRVKENNCSNEVNRLKASIEMLKYEKSVLQTLLSLEGEQ